MKIIDKKLIEMISWDKNPNSYDFRLHQLGKSYDEFLILNPSCENWILEYLDTSIDSNQCIMWVRNKEWIAKKFKKSWNPEHGWKIINVDLPLDVTYNPDVAKYKFDFNPQNISTYDLKYECVWYVRSKYTNEDDIWAVKVKLDNKQLETKNINMGIVSPILNEKFDVVFISYDEPNADENWNIVLSKAPDAQRVHGVKGIFEAHKAAAQLAKSDMVWIIDGDACLLDSWKFNYQPNVFNRKFVHVWASKNPINGLEYGYGGIKLFPRKLLLDAETCSLDVTTGLGNLKVMPRVSNITAFNTSEFSVWRSAFRECAKLSSGSITNQLDEETQRRLTTWLTAGTDRPFGEFAIAGAKAGYQFGTENKSNPDILVNINDREWLQSKFENFKNGKTTS